MVGSLMFVPCVTQHVGRDHERLCRCEHTSLSPPASRYWQEHQYMNAHTHEHRDYGFVIGLLVWFLAEHVVETPLVRVE